MWKIVTRSSTFVQINRAEWTPHTLLGFSHTWALHVCVGEPLVLLNGRHLPPPFVLPRALTSLSHRASSYALTALCIIRKCRSAERYQNWSQIVCSLPIRCYSFKFKFENNQKWMRNLSPSMKAEKLFSMGILTTLCVDALSTWWEKKEQDSGSKKN